ncbi:hypothetical protein pEaSNUABM29_00079 [Erwinia phage pEa_SNUABM_29]|nr:hypothetical protein pEaSNUABM29_00079 [Erwinia phage pEa_SNUABM_29]
MFKDAIRALKEGGEIVPFNRAIAEGVGYTQAKDGIHDRVSTILRRELTYDEIDNPKLPEGLTVLGCRHMSPFEAYIFKLSKSDNNSRNNRGRSIINISATDTYMVMASFRIPGDSRPVMRPISLPFIRRGGLMNYYGTTYHVAPVIHQPGICREHGGIFINFDFTRKVSIKFCKKPTKILVNGRPEQLFLPGTSNLFVSTGPIGHDTDEKPLMYWMFGRYGFKQAVERFTGVSVNIWPAIKVRDLDLNKYVVIQSGEPQLAKSIQYVLVVKKSDLPSVDVARWEPQEHLLLVALAAFFKAAHYYAGKQNSKNGRAPVLPGLFTQINEMAMDEDIANLNSAASWREVLGRSIRGLKPSDIELGRSMDSHFQECERYVNSTFRGELMANDPSIPDDMDMFDFLWYTTQLMVRTRLTKQDDIPSMYGKRLTVTDYLLLGQRGFTTTISKIRWKLGQLEHRTPETAAKSIRDALNKQIVLNLVLRNITGNGGISFFNASTESMVLAVSTHAIGQTETDAKRSKKGGKTVNLNDRTKHASASHLECGNVFYIPKSAPFKANILNPYMKTNPSLVMVRNPKLAPFIKPTEEDIAKIGR